MKVLPATNQRTLQVWWAHIWRFAIAMFCAQLFMAFIDLVTLPVLLKFNSDSALKVWTHGLHPLLKIAIYLLYSIPPLQLIIGKQFNGFHLALATRNPAPQSKESPSPHPKN